MSSRFLKIYVRSLGDRCSLEVQILCHRWSQIEAISVGEITLAVNVEMKKGLRAEP